MKNNRQKKHRFVHADPEKITVTASQHQSKTKKNNKFKNSGELDNVFYDLKGSVITITVFLIILFIFYVLNNNFNALDILKTKFF